MLSLSSQLFGRRVLQSIRYNCIKSFQTKSNPKTYQSSATFIAGNGFSQQIKNLESVIRNTGRISFNELNQCLKELSKSGTVRPTTTQSLFLIRSCGAMITDEKPEKRRDLCQKLFETLSEVTDLDISHYNQLMRVFVENNFEFDAIQLLEQMQSKGIEPNRVTFILMIERFCQMANISEAIRILEHMKSNDMPISESVFNSLIIGYGKAGDLPTAEQTLELMRSSGVEPSTGTYTALLCATALNLKDPKTEDKINKIFDEMTKSEIQLTENDILKVVKTIALVDYESPLLKQMLNRINKSFNYNKDCLDVINDLLFANKVDAALKVYETMEPTELMVRDKNAGTPLIRCMIRANISPETVIKICEKWEADGINDKAISLATEMALLYSDLDSCRQYMKCLGERQRLRIHYFYPFIVKCENENQILRVLSEDLSPFTLASYSELMDLFVNYVWPKNILDVHLFIDKCKEIGFSLVITYNSLLRYHILNSRLGDAIQLITSPIYSSVNLTRRELMNDLAEELLKPTSNLNDVIQCVKVISKQKSVKPTETTDQFGLFLLTLIRKNVSQILLNRILIEFNRNSVKISENSVSAIRERIQLSGESNDLLNKMMSKSLDDIRNVPYYDMDDIARPRRDMNVDELEGHLIELKSKGFNTRGVLRSLLMAYCRRTKFNDDFNQNVLVSAARNRIREIVAELNESNYEFSPAMQSMLMDFFINCGDIKSAEKLKDSIPEEFAIDAHKIINFATLYVKNGEINKAIDLIKVRAKRTQKSNTPDVEVDTTVNNRVNKQNDFTINRLLNSLIDAKVDYKQLKDVFELCIRQTGYTPTPTMAGPLIKYHILNENYSEALKEFENCVDNYQITPWKNQLIQHFMEKADQINLQKILDASNQIHGDMNTIMDLASICAEMGKLKQAKRLLDTPGLRVRQIKIDQICVHFIQENKIDALEQFIRCSKNVFDVNRDRMLYHLIRGCIKIESPEKALNCFTLMQEEDIQPSDETLILLANYLQQNNITVPFNVPPVSRTESVRQTESRPSDNTGPHDDAFHRFNEAIKSVNINEALKIRNSLEAEGKSLLMTQNCSLIETLLSSDRIDEALELSKTLLSSKRFPSPRIIRYLFSKLSSVGDYQRLEELRPILPDFLIQNNAFTNSLAMAYVNSGKSEELINEKLLKMSPFPLGAFLTILTKRPELEQRLITIANDLVREQEYHLPLNMVWITYMRSGRYEEAEQVYKSCPKLKDFLLFSNLLDAVREKKDIVLAKKLVQVVSDSNLTSKSIGVVYSSLIDAYLELGQIDAAEDVVVNDVANNKRTRIDSKSGVEIKLIDITHLNKSTINRLNRAVREQLQREPKFQMMSQKPNSVDVSSTSSSDDDINGSSSSDEEVVDIKNK